MTPQATDLKAKPSYLALLESGELHERVLALKALLSPCRLCPHRCGADRTKGRTGRCRVKGAMVATATAHFGEEPEVSGTKGAGTIFFRSCNMACIYCQNHQISQSPIEGEPDPPEAIAGHMLALAERGCHNIAWVTPSHVVPDLVEGLELAARSGLDLPIVYNTSGYDSVETLRLLQGVVDVYLPDLRYSDDLEARRLSGVKGYVTAARAAILEMARQVGTENVLGPDGTIRRGLIIRLLVLPNDLAGVRDSLRFIKAELGTSVRVALLSQYYPTHKAFSEVLLSRPVGLGEYMRVVEFAERLGFEHALWQEPSSSDFYRPEFDRGQEPFPDAKEFQAR